MKKFLIMQASCVFWALIISALFLNLGSSGQNLDLKSINLYDHNGVRRIFIGVPPGRAEAPTIQMMDPSGKFPLLGLATSKEGAEVTMRDSKGESALEFNVADKKVSIHGRNEKSNGGIHLSVADNVPLVALTNQSEKPQVGFCVTEEGGQFVLGDAYGFPCLALTSEKKDCSLILQELVTNRQKSFSYDFESGQMTFRDSKSGESLPLDFPSTESTVPSKRIGMKSLSRDNPVIRAD